MAKTARKFILIVMAGMFVFGFMFGYFVQGSTLLTTKDEVRGVREDLSDSQLELLLLSQSPERGCPILVNRTLAIDAELTGIVDDLRQTSPKDPLFEELKAEADSLSMKTWLLATAAEDNCRSDLVTSLYLFSWNDCERCEEQNEILQNLKSDDFLVYAIEYETDEELFNLVKSSYGIESAPATIIGGKVYGFLDREELESLVRDIRNSRR